MSLRRGALVGALLLAAGCNGSPTTEAGSAPASPSAVASASAPSDPARLGAIESAEQRRAAAEITSDDQRSRDVAVRRAAARALARTGGDGARAGLVRALGDEDPDVVAWAAYGLGFSCRGHEAENVSALVARGLSLEAVRPVRASGDGDAGAPADGTPALDPFAAIARAIGRCGAEASEPTLVAWLSGPRDRAIAASYALGDLASEKHRLREETIVALMNLAAGSAATAPVPEALYPVGRLGHVPLTVQDRVREVASARLATPGKARIFAVRALGLGGSDAPVELARVLGSADAFTPAERAEAARALGGLGKAGERALEGAIPALVPSTDAVAMTGLVGDDFGVLLAALDALDRPGAADEALRGLAALAVPPGAPATVVRRAAWLRCTSAKLLAGANPGDPRLVGCAGVAPGGDAGAPDPAGASIAARARVAVLGRAPIRGARLAIYRQLVGSPDVRVREAALGLLATHDEIDGADAILADALAAKETGVVASAADVIAQHPERAAEQAPRRRHKRRKKSDTMIDDEGPRPTSPAVAKAVLAALGRAGIDDDPEVLASVVDAAGALALGDALPRLQMICTSSLPTLRERAEKALALVAGKKVTCGAPRAADAPAELAKLVTEKTTLTFDTDVGTVTMTLDPTIAPVTTTRIVDLARAGYYDGNVVHRIVPGYVTQFGAPHGDGYGGPDGKPPLRCEASPLPFFAGAVGVADAGPDTGSSQLFVAHARSPKLDGRYAWIGTASGPWAAFADGDLIRSVKVSH